MLRRSSDMRAELQSKVGYARICMFLVSYTLCDFNNPISSQQATVCDVNLINMKFAARRFCTMKTQTERQPYDLPESTSTLQNKANEATFMNSEQLNPSSSTPHCCRLHLHPEYFECVLPQWQAADRLFVWV